MSLDPDRRYDYAKDAVSQVITLSTAILAVSLTFSKDWASKATSSQKHLLEGGWLLLLISTVMGVFSLSVLAGLATENDPSLRDKMLTIPWGIQLVAFGLALLLFLLFGFAVI